MKSIIMALGIEGVRLRLSNDIRLSELIKALQWWHERFGDQPVELSVVTNDPTLSRGRVIDIICNVSRKEGVNKIIVFGGNRK